MPTPRRRNPNAAKSRKGLKPGPKLEPDVALLANAVDAATGNATEIYLFRKGSGKYGTIPIPREQSLFDPRLVARIIAAKNGILPRDIKRATALVAKASRAEPKKRYRYAKQDGWRKDGTAFFHGRRGYGRKRVGSVELKPPVYNRKRNHPLSKKGSVKDWLKIAIAARYSTRIRMCVCAAFAAPLLRVIDLQSFIIVLAGPSKAGKSTAQLASASVIGIGGEGALPNMNATGASLQETAAEFNDRVLPVNEVGLINGAKRDAYPAVRTLTYRYAEGRDTGRHSKSQYSSETGTAEWRGIMLASSENTFSALAAAAGQTRDEGEHARAFDVPATRQGNPTVFDSFPKKVKPEEREAWARQQLSAIRQRAAENHGVVFGPYIDLLIEHQATLKPEVEGAMRDFTASLQGIGESGALQHARRNFAVLYAGAVMAKKAGLLPWSLAKTRADLRVCFMDGLKEISRVEAVEDRARHAILRQIGRLRPLSDEINAEPVDGWFTETRRGRLYAVKTPAFEDWFVDAGEELAALRWLHQAQLLRLRGTAKPEYSKTEWAMSFAKLGGKSQRCYQFWDPRKA